MKVFDRRDWKVKDKIELLPTSEEQGTIHLATIANSMKITGQRGNGLELD